MTTTKSKFKVVPRRLLFEGVEDKILELVMNKPVDAPVPAKFEHLEVPATPRSQSVDANPFK